MTTACWNKKKSGDIADCELELVEHQSDALQQKLDETAASNKALLRTFVIVRSYLVKNRLVCYGGTAINNLLPKKEQFYDSKGDIPDYDVFSKDPAQDAKDVVDALVKAGMDNVEARAGVHVGTFKVYADFVAVLDVTEMPPDVFQSLQAAAIPDTKDGLLYCHPMYLRVSMHLELSRPMGDVSRWTKVVERLKLLDEAYPASDDVSFERLRSVLQQVNTHWPIEISEDKVVHHHHHEEEQDAKKKKRGFGSLNDIFKSEKRQRREAEEAASARALPVIAFADDVGVEAKRISAAIDALISSNGVFCGVIARGIYLELDKGGGGKEGQESKPSSMHGLPALPVALTPMLDVLVHGLAECGGALAVALQCAKSARTIASEIAELIAKREKVTKSPKDLFASKVVGAVDAATGARLVLFPPVLDLVSWRLEYVAGDGRRLLAVYETTACHAFNETTLTHAMMSRAGLVPPRAKKMHVANLDASVSLLGQLAFIPHLQRPDALVTLRDLLTIFARHPLVQTGIWARFKLPCLGEQHGLVEMRQDKVAAFNAFLRKGIKSGREYDRWFLKYAPQEKKGGEGFEFEQWFIKHVSGKGDKAASSGTGCKKKHSTKTVRQRLGSSSSSSSGTKRAALRFPKWLLK